MFKKIDLKTKFLVTFISIIVVAISTVGYMGYSNGSKAYINSALERDIDILSKTSQEIEQFLISVPKDLSFIANSYSFDRYLQWSDIGVYSESEVRLHEVMDMLEAFIKTKEHYYKIRYLDLEGNEIIKVVFDNKGKTVLSQHKGDETDLGLQNKRDKDYFSIPSMYSKEDIYISPLNLNRESGKIITPYVPVIRFATPVIDENGVVHGVYVFNIYGEYIINSIKRNEQSGLFLIDEAGNYLYNKNEDKLWGADLGHGHSLRNDVPELFEKIKDGVIGNVFLGDKIYSFKKIYPYGRNSSTSWTLISERDKSEVLAGVQNFTVIFASLFVVVLLLAGYIINRFLNHILNPLRGATEHLKHLSVGKKISEEISYSGEDEVKEILRSIKALSINLSNTVEQANCIAEGDYSKKLIPRSDEDLITIALNNMRKKLDDNQRVNNSRTWLSKGIQGMAKNLSAEMSVRELAYNYLSYTCRYLNITKAGFFLVKEKQVELIYSFAGDLKKSSFSFGEGVVGQVAQEGKSILLKDESIETDTGVDKITLKSIYTFALTYENVVYGVVEFSFNNIFDERQEKFIRESKDVVGNYLYSVLQREKVASLLKISNSAQERAEKAAIEAEQQSMKLQSANAQMEEQQQQLKQQSEEFQTLNEQLSERQKELQASNKELEDSSRYKSEFLANMSHELRTPLNSIILLSKMLSKKDDLKIEDIERASVINKAGQELLRLINDILDLSKVESGKMEFLPSWFTIADLEKEFQGLFQPLAESKGISFRVENNLSALSLYSDKEKITQIIRNFLSNSFKFTKSGEVVFEVTNKGGEYPISLSVRDSGIGIAKEKLTTIFEAFQQVDGSISREYGGTGLGLSICTEYGKLINGKIEVESIEGEGSLFTLLINPKTKEIQKVESSVEDREDSILIIDDDYEFVKVVKGIIEERGLPVSYALNGKEGLEKAVSIKPKGIMLDLNLPDIDGNRVLKELKSDSRTKHLPVHIVSGMGKESLEGKEFFSFLQKPINVEDIEKILEDIKNYKNVLVVASNEEYTKIKSSFVQNVYIKNIALESVESELDSYTDLLIIDKESVESLDRVIRLLDEKAANCQLIVISERELNEREHESIDRYKNSVILKEEHFKNRLSDEVEHFLNGMEDKQSSVINIENKEIFKGKTILAVDDDVKNIFVLTSALEDKGAEVLSALDGQKAINKLKENRVDLVLMDIMMPVMNGYEAIEKIREDQELCNIPIIALTAKALKEDRDKCISVGADDYISKPVDYDKLMNLCTMWIDKKRV